MEEFFTRLVQEFGERLTGPMRFRFVLQPTMAAILAIRAGINDARYGKPPYFWAMFTNPGQWRALVREGWTAIAKIFTIALVMDVIYQLVVARSVRLIETVVVAITLAVLPYLLLRGPTNRLVRLFRGTATPTPRPGSVK